MISSRRGPRGWAGPLALVFLLLGVGFTYLLFKLHQWAKASANSATPIEMTGADTLLLGGGSVACFLIAGLLIAWRKGQ